MILTYKYRLKGKRSTRFLNSRAISVNQIWNKCVEIQKAICTKFVQTGEKTKWPTHFDLCKIFKGQSKTAGLHGQTLNGICDQFAKSRNQHKKTPKFRKSFGSNRSLGWVPFQKQSRQITESSVTYLGNTFRFFGAKRSPLPLTAKGGYFSQNARGYWYVCFHVEVEDNKNSGVGDVGIDLGLKNAYATSDGLVVEAPRFYRKLEVKLATAQRANNLSRVRALNEKIKNQRQDFLHKESLRLIERYDTVYIGNVSPSKLTKTKMAKSVLDVSMATFKSMLLYKAKRRGAKVIIVDESYTTQTCSACGLIPVSSPKGLDGLGIRQWVCSECFTPHDRDVNSAKNILKVGRSVTPLEEESRKV